MAQYINIRDMIDGGGAGKSGQNFEGGGLISDLGNLLFDPLGSRNAKYQNQMAPVSRAEQALTQDRPQVRQTSNNAGTSSSPIPKPNPYNSELDLRVLEDERQRVARQRMAFGFDVATRNPIGAPPIVNSTPPAQPKTKGLQNIQIVDPTPLSFEAFLGGLGDLQFKESPETLFKAYQQHMMGYK